MFSTNLPEPLPPVWTVRYPGVDSGTLAVTVATCAWCGCIHNAKCPLVKAIEYHANGTVKRVEFYDPPKHP